MKTAAALIAILGLGAILTGCEGAQSEKDMIAEAQFCLDDATDGASSDACLAKISGLTSPQANTLRCAGGFITAQITSPQNLSKALNAISDGQGATALLSSLSFPNVSLANTTFEYCNQSSQAGLKLIGAMAKSATVLASAATSLGSCSSITDCNPSEMEDTLTDLVADLQTGTPTQASKDTVVAVVTAVQTVYASTCGGTNNSNADICAQINTAVAGSGVDVTATDEASLLLIGEKLLEQWKH